MSNSIFSKAKKIFAGLRNGKIIQYIVVAILAIVLISVLCFGFKSDTESTEESSDIVTAYVDNLESKLSETLSKVSGAGQVAVVITVESGMETVLAKKIVTTETVNGIETEESPITVNGKTVIIKELYPKITGVLIVAQGASNIAVLSKLQQATVSLLNINLDQIEILTMK